MLFGKDIGIDLGTSTVRICVRDKGIVLREPAVIAVDRVSGRVLSVGAEAQKMLGRTPVNLAAIRPMRDGVVSDFEMAERLLRELLRKVSGFSLLKPRLLISVPSGITEVEERAVMEAALQAGARRVFLLEEPVAAALGAGLSISEPKGKMVIDIGAGATDIAVLSLSGVVESASIRLAGDRFNEALIRYVRRKHNILIGDRTAEELKLQLGCVYPGQESRSLEVKGRCLLTGLPKLFPIHTEEMLEAFDESCEGILDAIRDVLERTPPELVSDISETGITLTGGGSQLWGMDKLIESRTRISTQLADDGHECVISGLERALNWLDDMQDGAVHFSRRKQMS
ncbi:MAG: rod shape-determining protein [Oscillospiraceae bacterium]|nr:rod shape-determining protein [Oscillospiraceae bacterium]